MSAKFKTCLEENCAASGINLRIQKNILNSKFTLSDSNHLIAGVREKFSLAHVGPMLLDQFIPSKKHIISMMEKIKKESAAMGLSTSFSFIETKIPASLSGYPTDQLITQIPHETLKRLQEKTDIEPHLKIAITQYLEFRKSTIEQMVCMKLYEPVPAPSEQVRMMARLSEESRSADFTISDDMSTYLGHIDDAESIINPANLDPSALAILTESTLEKISYLPSQSYREVWQAFDRESDPCKALYHLNKKLQVSLSDTTISKAPYEEGVLALGPEDAKRELIRVIVQMAKDGRHDLIAKILTMDPSLIAEYKGADITLEEKLALTNTLINLSEGAWRLMGASDPNLETGFNLVTSLMDS